MKEDEFLVDAFNLNDYFSDVDDTLTFSFSNSTNVFPQIASNGSVSFSVAANWSGTENILFRADDLYGTFNTIWVRVTVLPVNDPPGFVHRLLDQYAPEDAFFYWNIGGCIYDVDKMNRMND